MNQKSNEVEVLESEPVARTIYECLSPRVKQAIDEMSQEIRTLPLIELEDRISLTPTLRRVKISLWNQYRRTVDQNLKYISPTAICEDICSTVFWDVHIVRREEVLAWMFHAPTSFDIKAEEALDYGIDRLREEILTAPLYSTNPDGSRGAFNKDNANVVLNAIKFLDARVKGSPLQRIEQKSLHLHKNADSPKGITRDELDAEIQALSQRLGGDTLLIKAPDETE